VSWIDAATVIDNEAGRRRIRVDECDRRLADPDLTVRDRETVRAIRGEAVREAAAFDVVSRLIERMRDPYIVDRLRELAEAEAREADVAVDHVQGE
jgi:hypothetical protein